MKSSKDKGIIFSKTRIILGSLLISGAIGIGTGCETINMNEVMNSLTNISPDGGLSQANIESALREALVVGTNKTVALTSADGGYSNNPLIKIPMPVELAKISKTLTSLGLGSYVTEFNTKMNEAAEQAAALAGPVFTDAVTNMNFDDVQNVFNGGDTAATNYFKKNTADKLTNIYTPIVKEKMKEVGAVDVYNNMVKRYNEIPFVKKVNFNIENYVTTNALEGLFKTLALEETKIRQNPAARTTELLKMVFGSTK